MTFKAALFAKLKNFNPEAQRSITVYKLIQDTVTVSIKLCIPNCSHTHKFAYMNKTKCWQPVVWSLCSSINTKLARFLHKFDDLKIANFFNPKEV